MLALSPPVSTFGVLTHSVCDGREQLCDGFDYKFASLALDSFPQFVKRHSLSSTIVCSLFESTFWVFDRVRGNHSLRVTPSRHCICNCMINKFFHTLSEYIYICSINHHLLWLQRTWRWPDIVFVPKAMHRFPLLLQVITFKRTTALLTPTLPIRCKKAGKGNRWPYITSGRLVRSYRNGRSDWVNAYEFVLYNILESFGIG